MPVYEFRCTSCRAVRDELRRLGEVEPGNCPDCGASMRLRFGRVGVSYHAWGFDSTDSLVRRPGRHDFRTVREKAEQIAEDPG